MHELCELSCLSAALFVASSLCRQLVWGCARGFLIAPHPAHFLPPSPPAPFSHMPCTCTHTHTHATIAVLFWVRLHSQTTSVGLETVRTRSNAIIDGDLDVKKNLYLEGQLLQRSDRRTKGNIQPTGAGEDAANLHHLRRVDTVEYDETQGPMAGQHVSHGFIAQNIKAEFPGAVQSIRPDIIDGALVDDRIGFDQGAMLSILASATKAVDRSKRILFLFARSLFLFGVRSLSRISIFLSLYVNIFISCFLAS